jgi:hypothetical protein
MPLLTHPRPSHPRRHRSPLCRARRSPRDHLLFLFGVPLLS